MTKRRKTTNSSVETGSDMKDWHSAVDIVGDEAKKRDDESKREQECQNAIDDVFKTINTDQAEYDKQLLTLSSGFLAVSLAFIKDIVHLPDARFLPILYLTFVWFSICIVSVLFSYQFSISVNLKAKEYWESKRAGNDPAFPYARAEWVKWLNRASGILFALGISFIVVFVILNLHREAHMARVNDGALIKTPASGNTEDRGSLVKAPAKPAATPPSSSSGNNQTKK